MKPDKEGTIRKTRKFIKSLPTDNPHLEKAYLDNLLQADPVTVQRLYFGTFSSMTRTLQTCATLMQYVICSIMSIYREVGAT